jgi:hypothetical protein
MTSSPLVSGWKDPDGHPLPASLAELQRWVAALEVALAKATEAMAAQKAERGRAEHDLRSNDGSLGDERCASHPQGE